MEDNKTENIPLQNRTDKSDSTTYQSACMVEKTYREDDRTTAVYSDKSSSHSGNDVMDSIEDCNGELFDIRNGGVEITENLEDGECDVTATNQPALTDKIIRTIAIDAAYVCAALHLGIIGPSQLDLQALTHTNKAQITMIYTVRSIMAIIASLLMGPILDRYNRYIVVTISLIMSSAFTIAGPWSRSLEAVLLTLGPPEFFGCTLGMGSHLLCVEIWGSKSGPWLQLLNFVSVTGFTVAPLLVKPFLHEEPGHLQNNSYSNNEIIALVKNETESNRVLSYNETESNSGGNYVIYITYLIVGIYGFVIALVFMVIICKDKIHKNYKNVELDNNDQVPIPEENSDHGFSKGQLYLMYFLYFWMILFYGGIEVAYPGQITSFVNSHLHWSKTTGASLASVVMGSNAAFTFLGILLSMFIPPIILIWIDVIGLCISMAILSVFVEAYPWSIWLSSSLLGISSATIMPSAYTLANQLFPITWLFNSAFWCGFFSGFMISNLTGFLMHQFGSMWYCYTLLICSILVIIMFLLLTLCAMKHKHWKTVLYQHEYHCSWLCIKGIYSRTLRKWLS